MIKIINKNGIYAPFVFCDCCGKKIDDVNSGIVFYTKDPRESESISYLHCHKGYCDHDLRNIHGDYGWDELSHHLVYLHKNMDITKEHQFMAIRVMDF